MESQKDNLKKSTMKIVTSTLGTWTGDKGIGGYAILWGKVSWKIPFAPIIATDWQL
jgi:hypothetical protein